MKLSNKFTFVRVIFAPVFFALYFIPVWTERFALITTALMIPLLLFAEFTDYQEACIFARKNGGYVGYRHY